MIPGFKKIRPRPTLHTAARAVPSALKSLTSVFEMGTGVTSWLLPPKIDFSCLVFGVSCLVDFKGLKRREPNIKYETPNTNSNLSFQHETLAFENNHVNYFVAKPHDRLVPVSLIRCRTYTPGLSTL